MFRRPIAESDLFQTTFNRQAALTSLEREAKENVYAVLDPHIQYELTINKHGEPPKYFSLSKPLKHQRAHAFDQQIINNEMNNNDSNENRFSTFKAGPPKVRRSNKSNEGKPNTNHIYVSKTNNDIEYSKNPFFGMTRDEENNIDIHNFGHNENRNSKNYSRMYERNNSGRKHSHGRGNLDKHDQDYRADAKRHSKRSWRLEDERNNQARIKENDRSFEELKEESNARHGDGTNDDRPRPGKVREIASRFDRNCSRNDDHSEMKRARPRPLQSYGHQPYLDHVFPDAIEI